MSHLRWRVQLPVHGAPRPVALQETRHADQTLPLQVDILVWILLLCGDGVNAQLQCNSNSKADSCPEERGCFEQKTDETAGSWGVTPREVEGVSLRFVWAEESRALRGKSKVTPGRLEQTPFFFFLSFFFSKQLLLALGPTGHRGPSWKVCTQLCLWVTVQACSLSAERDEEESNLPQLSSWQQRCSANAKSLFSGTNTGLVLFFPLDYCPVKRQVYW